MKKIYIFFSMALTVLMMSCEKKLSEPPTNAKVDGNVIVDQKSALVALNGVYYRFANVNANNVTDWTNHNVPGAMLAGTLSYGLNQFDEELNINNNSSLVPPLWTDTYKLINAANGVLGAMDQVPDAMFTGNKKKEIIAEATFLRAYGNFKILMFFSEWNNLSSKNGVLLRDKLSTLSSAAKQRSSVAESYNAIITDLDYAIANGPATNPGQYVNKWAAMAFKMRVLACRGAAGDFAQMITLADNIIQNSPYALEPKLKDLFYTKGLASTEVMLGTKPQANQQNSYFILSRAYYPIQSSFYVATKQFKDLLANDPRGSWMLDAETPFQAVKPNTYYFTKFIPFGTAPSQISETCYAIRLSEVYLLKAEAIIRSGGDLAMAKQLIKTIMSKSEVTDFSNVDNAQTANALLLENYKEVLKNFTGEDGIEWMSLIRLPFNNIQQLRPTITLPQQLYFRVPRTEFELNQLFGEQNKGYSID